MNISFKKKKSLLDKIGLAPLAFLVLSAGAIELKLDGVIWQTLSSIILATVVGYTIVAIKTDWLKDSRLQRFIQKEGVLPIIGLIVLVGMTMGFLIAPHEVHAQMFFTPEADIVTAITTATTGTTDSVKSGTALKTLIALIFTFYRIILAMGIVGVIVKIGVQMREEQEWKDTMKIPLLIFALLTVGDFTLGYII